MTDALEQYLDCVRDLLKTHTATPFDIVASMARTINQQVEADMMSHERANTLLTFFEGQVMKLAREEGVFPFNEENLEKLR
jgi:hypothetical protein